MVLTLVIFVLGVWSLAFLGVRELRDNMQSVLGQQQYSTATFVARDTNHELQQRLDALDHVATQLGVAMGNKVALQALLDRQQLSSESFNGGIVVYGLDGAVMAGRTIPPELANTLHQEDHVAAVIADGKSSIGEPHFASAQSNPEFCITVAIRDSKGQVLGALKGITLLDRPNFLDEISNGRYGSTGGYVLVAPQHQRVVTASDKRRIMARLPDAGVSPMLDRYTAGYEGTDSFINPMSVAVLASVKQVPVAHWYLAVTMPMEEVLAPIHAMQQRTLLATAWLTLLVAGLIWWMLRRQLAPLSSTAKTLADWAAKNQAPQALEITRADEVGQFIASFNGLLIAMTRQDEALKESEFRWKFAVESAGDALWDWNVPQNKLYFSERWKDMLGYDRNDAIGNDLQEWERRLHPDDRATAVTQLQNHLNGKTSTYVSEYRMQRKDGSYLWLLDRGAVVSRTADGQPLRAIGTHTDISERKLIQARLDLEASRARAMLSLPKASRSLDERSFMQHGLELIESLTASQIAFIHLVHEDQESIELVAWSHDTLAYYCNAVFDSHYPVSQAGIWADALRQRAPVVLNDYAIANGKRGLPEGHSQLDRLISFPVIEGEVVRMLVGVGNKTEPYTEIDVETVRLLADAIFRLVHQRRVDASLRDSEVFKQGILNAVTAEIAVVNAEGTIIAVNEPWRRFAQNNSADPDKVISATDVGVNYLTVCSAATDAAAGDGRQASNGIRAVMDGTLPSFSMEYPCDAPLQPRWFNMTVTPLKLPSHAGVVVTHNDITAQKLQQIQLKLSAKVFAQSNEGITVTDAHGQILMVNQAFTEITGYGQDEVLGQNPRLLQSGRQDKAFYKSLWEIVANTGRWEGEIWNRHKNGTIYPEWLSISALRDDQGQTTHYVGSFSDLTDSKAAENRIHWLSHFDSLTSLPNRTLVQDRTEHAISMMQRAGDPLTLMLVSVDNFSAISETLGHQVGDALLIALAKRLKDFVREQDTVARVSGKEFMLVLPGTPEDGAAHLASALLKELVGPAQIDDHELTLDISIGIAIFPTNGADFDALFKSAEVAVHRTQASGRNSFQFYSDDMYQQVVARDQMVKALRHAAERDQLSLVYQPLVDLQTGQICGLEALCRWSHPELGEVPPAQFILVAEQSGLIVSLGEWVLRRACQDIRSWQDKKISVGQVAINFSPIQFRDSDLVGLVKSAADEAGITASSIYVEVTESALMDDGPRSEATLRGLKALGAQLALDDFGTGYSSLSYLKHLPFDKVKIDQSFVREVATRKSDQTLANVIISMAHGLGMKVIAEGVETEAQCEFLRANTCDEIQGYFFCKPVSALGIESLISEGRQLPPHLRRDRQPQRTLLLVDDEPAILSSLKRLFRRDGHIILTAESGAQGLEVLSTNRVDVIISDQRMPDMTGVEFLRIAKTRYPDTIRIVLSGYTELQSVTDAINEGAIYRFLTKPWDDVHLHEQLQDAFKYKDTLEENRQLDLKTRTANQELAAANRRLTDVLELKNLQLELDRSAMRRLVEAWQSHPWPVLGIDTEGRVAFANAAAQQLPSDGLFALGVKLSALLPTLDAAMADPQNSSCQLPLGAASYQANWHNIGGNSQDLSKIVTLRLTPPIPEINQNSEVT